MKVSEFKLRAVTGINKLIDEYFGGDNMKDKFVNSTLKVIVKQNQHKFDNILEIFSDEKGEINTTTIIDQYSDVIGGDGFVIDIRDFIKNDWLRSMLPNKALKVKKEDILNMFV